jgi:hypothetical protein
MKDKTDVSIIVPCYNQAQYLDEALKSVLDQTYANWECIIVNDGSTDNTEEVALSWCAKDIRFKYFFQENGGLSSARNLGLDNVNGEYIQFLDSDDTINKFKLERQLKYFDDKIAIVICDYFPFDQETGTFVNRRYMDPFPGFENYKKDIINKWESDLSIPCHCVLFKAKLLHQKRLIRFEQSLPNHEDWVFWVKLFHYAYGIYNLKEVLANYRIHNESMCTDNVKMNRGFILACKANQSFFESIGDKISLELCLKKLKLLETKKTFKYKSFINFFIPPVIFKILNKLSK